MKHSVLVWICVAGLTACASSTPPANEPLPEGCTSQAQVDEFKRQIADFYDEKDVLKKIVDPIDHTTYDCLRIEKQPSLKGSGLSAKDIPRHPAGFPDAPKPAVQNPNTCPEDTVPFTRPTLRELCNPPPQKVAPPRPTSVQ